MNGVALRLLLVTLAAALLARADPAPPCVVEPLFGSVADDSEPAQWGFGPIDSRDPFPLALAHFTIPIESPETTPVGHPRFSTLVTWGGTQVFSTDGEAIDVESVLARLQGRFGLTERWELVGEIPFHWIGSGTLDRVTNVVHDIINDKNPNREGHRNDSYEFHLGETSIARGCRLGDAALGTKFRLLDGGKYWPALSLSGWVKIPTSSSESLGRQGWDAALSAQVSKRFGPLIAQGGGGLWGTTDSWLGDIHYKSWAWTAWGGLELQLLPGVVLEGHASYRSRLITQNGELGRTAAYVVGGFRARKRIQLGDTIFEVDATLGLMENIAHLESTADFAFVGGVEIRF